MPDALRAFDIFLPGEPPSVTHHAKRIVRRGSGGRPILADDPQLAAARRTYAMLLLSQRAYKPDAPLRAPISLTMLFVHKPKAGRSAGFWKLTKPDCSNAVKAIEDELVHERWISDDQGVAHLNIGKVEADKPGVQIWARELHWQADPGLLAHALLDLEMFIPAGGAK